MKAEEEREVDPILEIGLMAAIKENRIFSDKNCGRAFPASDTEDRSMGARFIPDEVVLLRREGWEVEFVQECSPCCWYWEFIDRRGDLVRIYHWEENEYLWIAERNGLREEKVDYKRFFYDADDKLCEDGPGPCPVCGNANVRGGRVIVRAAEELAIERLIESEENKVVDRFMMEVIKDYYQVECYWRR
jgi:hypothetical protein